MASEMPGMDVESVLAVLRALWQARWGVDALVGRQTRSRRNLDFAVDADQEAAALEALGRLGYVVETDWRPVRVELVAAQRRWVDLHPVVFDASGNGHQADVDGGVFAYPGGCFTAGVIGGVSVPCLSLNQQPQFRRGYQLRSVDREDLTLLRGLEIDNGQRERRAP